MTTADNFQFTATILYKSAHGAANQRAPVHGRTRAHNLPHKANDTRYLAARSGRTHLRVGIADYLGEKM